MVTTIASTYTSVNNNDGNNSVVSSDVYGGSGVHDKNEENKESGRINFNITATSDTTYEEHDTGIIANDTDSESVTDSSVVESTSSGSVPSNNTVGNVNKNGIDTARKRTAVEGIMDRTSDEELVYLYVLKRKEDKRIRSSIANHITGSSKNYSRAASICKPSIITIQKFVRRFILKNSITSQKLYIMVAAVVVSILWILWRLRRRTMEVIIVPE